MDAAYSVLRIWQSLSFLYSSHMSKINTDRRNFEVLRFFVDKMLQFHMAYINSITLYIYSVHKYEYHLLDYWWLWIRCNASHRAEIEGNKFALKINASTTYFYSFLSFYKRCLYVLASLSLVSLALASSFFLFFSLSIPFSFLISPYVSLCHFPLSLSLVAVFALKSAFTTINSNKFATLTENRFIHPESVVDFVKYHFDVFVEQ